MVWAPNPAKLSRGDAQEWRRLVEAYEAALLTHARRIVGSAADAEDVVQAVFCQLWLGRDAIPRIEKLQSYLVASVRNRSRSLTRTRGRQGITVYFDTVADQAVGEGHVDPAQALETQEEIERMHEALAELTEVQHQVLSELRADPDRSSRDIAGRIGCSHKNVLAIIGRIRRKVAHWLAAG